jgi:hypothetical protein
MRGGSSSPSGRTEEPCKGVAFSLRMLAPSSRRRAWQGVADNSDSRGNIPPRLEVSAWGRAWRREGEQAPAPLLNRGRGARLRCRGRAAPKLDAQRLPVRTAAESAGATATPTRAAVPSKRRFPSERVAARDREHPVARRRDGGFYVSRLTFGRVLTSLATGARPIWRRAPGLTTRGKAASGRCRISAQRRPDDDHHVNALGVLVAVLNGAEAEPSWRSTGARGRAPAARPH